LRNPLAPAVTALELMKARNPDVFKRERAVLERQVVHMVRLVNDLLDVSRLTRGKVHLRRSRFELRDAVSRAVDMARPLMIEYAHDFEVKVPVEGFVIDGDIDRIVQVLSNLLTNAARYTPPGGSVSLTASRDGARVVIACEDTGPGIPADLAPSLFEPFAQGPRALDRREGGLGLGLALARTFTDLHGGTIRLDTPSTGTGTRVVVTLPSAPDATLDTQAAPRSAAAVSRPASLLVVDDNADAREMLQTALSEAGHTVAVAGTGHEAISIASNRTFDAAILDIGLPGMNGYDLAHHLRKMQPSMRLVALTGYGQQSDVDAAAAAGFDAHYAKPIRIETLLDDIASVGSTLPG
jgi:CheY-like chemotaxis protein